MPARERQVSVRVCADSEYNTKESIEEKFEKFPQTMGFRGGKKEKSGEGKKKQTHGRNNGTACRSLWHNEAISTATQLV